MSIEDRLEAAERQIAILHAHRCSQPGMRLFALASSEDYAQAISVHLNMELSPLIEKYHADGEVYMRPGCNVRRSTAFIIASLYSDNNESVNDKLAKTKYLAGALADASAAEVVVVAPFFPYGRSDRKTKSREPVITKYLAREMAAVGVNHIITIDVHSLQAFQNSAPNGCRTDPLEAKLLFANFFAERLADEPASRIGILSPDEGGFKRSERFRRALERRLGNGIAISHYDKQRDDKDSEKITGKCIIGEVRPITIIFDDMMGTCRTMRRASDAAHKAGAEFVYLSATHGLFVEPACTQLDIDYPHAVVISDTIPPFRLSKEHLGTTHIIPTAHLFAEAIRRTNTGESLSSLFED